MQNSLSQCFLTLICISGLSVKMEEKSIFTVLAVLESQPYAFPITLNASKLDMIPFFFVVQDLIAVLCSLKALYIRLQHHRAT